MKFSCMRYTIGSVLLAMALFLYGCGGGGAGSSNGGTPTPPTGTYKISGSVQDGNGNVIAGATVTAQQTATSKVTMAAVTQYTQYTDGNGAYTFTGLGSGTYNISVSYLKDGVATPLAAQLVTVNDTDATAQDVKAAGVTVYTVSGTVTRPDNNGQTLAGIKIELKQRRSLTDPSFTGVTYLTPVATGSDGRYNISVTASGFYDVTPKLDPLLYPAGDEYVLGTQSGDTTFIIGQNQITTINITAVSKENTTGVGGSTSTGSH